ncbi:MAG TPA: FAD-dependent oxidoreductase [Trebonia sp.]|nr:FAD-dependent oxidoreductase [Trebonia sp.]
MERPYVGAGLVLYDATEGTRRPVPYHRHLTARGALRRVPALRAELLADAMVYYDAQVDDARYTVTVARTAARYGAVVVTRAAAVSLLRDGARVTDARVRDGETGHVFDVRAAAVMVCADVWSDLVHEEIGVRAGYQVRMSKGVHLVMPGSAIDAETGMIVRTSKSVLFFIPWGDRWIVGTTDTDWLGDRAEPAATVEDVAYLLEEANRVPARPLSRLDVLAVYAGLRPLAEAAGQPDGRAGGNPDGRAGSSGDGEVVSEAADKAASSTGGKPTTKLSREHVVDAPLPGLTSIVGGKFTTYRLMARDVVDAAVAGLPGATPPSVTGHLPLLGADGCGAGRAIRTETTLNQPRDLGTGKELTNLAAMAKAGYAASRRLLDAEMITHDPAAGTAALETLTSPVISTTCTRVPGMRFPGPRVQALLAPLCALALGPAGFTSRDLRHHLAPQLGKQPGDMSGGQISYDLRRLRAHQIIERIPHSRSYQVTPDGPSTALFFTRLTRRVIIPALADIAAPGSPCGSPIHQADRAYRQAVAGLTAQASLGIQTRGATKTKSHERQVAVGNRSR